MLLCITAVFSLYSQNTVSKTETENTITDYNISNTNKIRYYFTKTIPHNLYKIEHYCDEKVYRTYLIEYEY